MRPVQALAIAMVLVAIATFFIGYYVSPPKTITTTQTVAYTVTTTFTQAITPTVAPSTTTIIQTVVKEVSRHEVKYPITIVDSAGRTVTIEKEPQRVVVASTAFYLLLALGVGDKIVGVTDFYYKDPILMSILIKQKGGKGDVINIGPSPGGFEAILSANPDLVIVPSRVQRSAVDELVKKLPPNITTVYFDGYMPVDVFDETYKLGLIFNKVDKALELISKWSARFAYVVARSGDIKLSDRAKVYWEGPRDYQTSGPGGYWHQMLTLAGGINIFEDAQTTWPTISPEAVIERNPDVIIKYTWYYNPCTFNSSKPLKDLYYQVISRPGWDKINAVKNNRVYVFTGSYLYGPGHTAVIALVAKLLYPDVFRGIDPQQWIYDWLRDMGLENPEQVCKLPWVYPAIPSK